MRIPRLSVTVLALVLAGCASTPAAGAAALQIGHTDPRLSRWGRRQAPLFGSAANATRWSDRLRSAAVGVDIASLLFAPSGPPGGAWLRDTAQGYRVNRVAATAAVESGTGLQHRVRRERPNRANDHSFPSDQASLASA